MKRLGILLSCAAALAGCYSSSTAPLPQPRVDVLAKLVRDEGFDTVLFAQSVLAADIAAGLAARLGAGLNWDLVELGVDGVGKRAALVMFVRARVEGQSLLAGSSSRRLVQVTVR